MKLMSNVSFLYYCIGLFLRKRSCKSKKPDKIVPKKKCMPYSVEDFEKAVSAVTDDKKSIRSAAKEFNIPHKTLSDSINGRHPKNIARPTNLTEAEKNIINKVYQIYGKS